MQYEQKLISAKKLHTELGMKKAFSTWIKKSIDRAMLDENIDFFYKKKESTGGRPSIDYELTIESAMIITSISMKTNKKGIILYKKLAKTNGTEVYIIPRTRKELLFEINLNEMFKNITEVIPQYSVLNYRIDFYFPVFNLAIEYDELHHELNHIKDKERQSLIEQKLECKFIRIKENQEIEGMNKILQFIIFKLLIDGIYKYDMKEDFIGMSQLIGENIGNIIWNDYNTSIKFPTNHNESLESAIKKDQLKLK
jgi:phage anti-repressor protein/very-short-patch-repair endonuclease